MVVGGGTFILHLKIERTKYNIDKCVKSRKVIFSRPPTKIDKILENHFYGLR